MGEEALQDRFTALQAGSAAAILSAFSLEVTGRDIDTIAGCAAAIPPGTRISITALPNEDLDVRAASAETVRRHGFVPVPHISARRLASASALERFLARVTQDAAVDSVLVIGGDLAQPIGPFADAADVIRTGLLAQAGIRHVAVAGYPGGHPGIASAMLARALRDKLDLLAGFGHDCSIITQFGFEVAPIVSWIAELRRQGIGADVRIGVAGPASARSLLRFAARCGVGVSLSAMAKYGMSLSRLLAPTGPDALLTELRAGLEQSGLTAATRIQLYPFGGLEKTVAWAQQVMASTAHRDWPGTSRRMTQDALSSAPWP